MFHSVKSGHLLVRYPEFYLFFQEQYLVVPSLGPSEISHWTRSAETIKIVFCSCEF